MAGSAPQRFPLIEGLRGVAALSVLYYHGAYKGYLKNVGPDELRAWASHLDVGVSLFFVISGFLLYRPFVAARLERRPAPDRDDYARRRFMRIVPAYWTVLIVAGLAGLSYQGYPEIFSAQGIPAYFGFLQIYNANTGAGGINTAWTLCVEVTFYIFLPVWAMWLRRLSPRGGIRSEYATLATLAAASVVFQAIAVHQVDPSQFGRSAAPWIEPLPNFLDQFAVGMALAVASVHWQNGGRLGILAAVVRRPWVAWVGALVAYWMMSTRLGLSGAAQDEMTPARYLAVHHLKTAVALGIVLPAVVPGAGGLIRGIVGGRPMRFAGAISYGLYLVQVPVMVALIKLGMPRTSLFEIVLYLAAVTGVCGLLAYALHVAVEKPAIRLGRRPRARRTPVPAPQPARS